MLGEKLGSEVLACVFFFWAVWEGRAEDRMRGRKVMRIWFRGFLTVCFYFGLFGKVEQRIEGEEGAVRAYVLRCVSRVGPALPPRTRFGRHWNESSLLL